MILVYAVFGIFNSQDQLKDCYSKHLTLDISEKDDVGGIVCARLYNERMQINEEVAKSRYHTLPLSVSITKL